MIQNQLPAQNFLSHGEASGSGSPGIPSSVTIALTSTSAAVLVQWNYTGTPLGFQVFRSANGGAFSQIASVSGATHQYNDTAGMPGNTLWTYKVRATGGSFSTTVSASNTIVDTTSVNVSFPDLLIAFGSTSLSYSGNTNLLTFSAPNLVQSYGDILFTNALAMTSLTLTSYKTNQNGGFIFDNAGLASISLPALTSIAGGFSAATCPNLVTISMPVITSIGAPSAAGFIAPGSSKLQTINAPVLQSVGNLTGGDLSFFSCAQLSTLNLGSLQSIGGSLWLYVCTALSSISFPALTTVGGGAGTGGGGIDVHGCPSLASVSLPNLNNSPSLSDFDFSSCGVLTTLTFTNVLFPDNGEIISFDSDILTAASVNLVLRRGVISGCTGEFFALNSPGNAAPTGQGLLDKATLIAAGNTVQTN